VLSAWRVERYKQEVKRGVKPVYGFHQAINGAGQCALLVNVMGNKGTISAEAAKAFLLDETFPKGWKARKVSDIAMFSTSIKCATGYVVKGVWKKVDSAFKQQLTRLFKAQ
jgi:hypothetical protein